MIEFEKELRGDGAVIETIGKYDVAVVGGGAAGCAAAIASAKMGRRTLLCEAGSALGGLCTLGLVNIPLDFVSGLGREMFAGLEAVNGLAHRNTDPEKHKLVLDRMMKKYGVEVLLATQVVDAIVEGSAIRGIILQTKRGRRAVLADRVVDASGDSDAAYYAGARCVSGRPSDQMSQACSLEFTLGGVDWDEYLDSDIKNNDGKWIKTIARDLASGELEYESDNHVNWITHLPGRPEHCGMDEVSICFAHSRRCYPLDPRDVTRMYLEGREQADMLSRYIKRRIPGFSKSFLTQTAPLLGVRESRRIVGEYILTARDLASLRKHDDVIAISSHGYDIHNFEAPGNIKWAEMEINGKKEYVICNPMGFGTTVEPPDGAEVVNYRGERAGDAKFEQNGYYDIPYRSLVPEKLDNLLAAGRNLSSDVNAQSGARLIMACFTMGEAAGCASALSLEHNVTPRALDVKELQRTLIAGGVNLGQNYRDIPGVSAGKFEEKYQNPEFNRKKHVTILQNE